MCVVYVERGELIIAEECLTKAYQLAPHEDYILRHLKIVRSRISKVYNSHQSSGSSDNFEDKVDEQFHEPTEYFEEETNEKHSYSSTAYFSDDHGSSSSSDNEEYYMNKRKTGNYKESHSSQSIDEDLQDNTRGKNFDEYSSKNHQDVLGADNKDTSNMYGFEKKESDRKITNTEQNNNERTNDSERKKERTKGSDKLNEKNYSYSKKKNDNKIEDKSDHRNNYDKASRKFSTEKIDKHVNMKETKQINNTKDINNKRRNSEINQNNSDPLGGSNGRRKGSSRGSYRPVNSSEKKPLRYQQPDPVS